jgi:hypothetical protein
MPTNSSAYINEKIFLSSVESITHPHKCCVRNGTSCILKARYVNLVFSLLLLTRVLRYWFSTQTHFPSWGFWFITPGFVICLVYLMGVQEIQGGSWFGSFCVVLSKLHIGAATLNPNFPNYRNRVIVKPLVFLIRQCLCRSHSNRIPGVNSHRVDILNGAYDDHICHMAFGVNPACLVSDDMSQNTPSSNFAKAFDNVVEISSSRFLSPLLCYGSWKDFSMWARRGFYPTRTDQFQINGGWWCFTRWDPRGERVVCRLLGSYSFHPSRDFLLSLLDRALTGAHQICHCKAPSHRA